MQRYSMITTFKVIYLNEHWSSSTSGLFQSLGILPLLQRTNFDKNTEQQSSLKIKGISDSPYSTYSGNSVIQNTFFWTAN